MQIAKAISVRLIKDHDPSEWIPRLRQMMKDGRLPADAAKPFFEIIKAHDQELLTSRSRDHKHAMDMIALAETFHRVMSSAADLTAYRQSPEVCQAIAAKGARLPYAPFAR
nr:hypothetical protein [Neorhizobium tomejilense]